MTDEELLARAHDPDNIPFVLSKDLAAGMAALLEVALALPGMADNSPLLHGEISKFLTDLCTKLTEDGYLFFQKLETEPLVNIDPYFEGEMSLSDWLEPSDED